MPRFETTRLDHDLLYDRWIIFGAWLRGRRRIAGLTQAEIALAVGVSRRQWILYEHGSKMLRKRFEAAAPILKVPLETMLNRAAYKVSQAQRHKKTPCDSLRPFVCGQDTPGGTVG